MIPCALCKKEFNFKLIEHPDGVLLCKNCASHVKGVGIQFVHPTGDFFILTKGQYELFMKIIIMRDMVDGLMAEIVADRLEGKDANGTVYDN